MVTLWCLIGLVITTIGVATLGAAFSVVGLSSLFSGAVLAIGAMAISLEMAKFFLAAYLHQRWIHLNRLFKYYLVSAVVILSLITSMGIFGFLSNAYQSASIILDAENIKLTSLKTQQSNISAEITRINKSIEEIPPQRVTKKMQARAEAEPKVSAMTQEISALDKEVAAANIKILAVKEKVGPLIYIAKIFNISIDLVVKYLMLILLLVFDPLAICLVIATSDALKSRKQLFGLRRPGEQPINRDAA